MIFALFFAFWSLRTVGGAELFGRSLLYVFMLSSPFALLFSSLLHRDVLLPRFIGRIFGQRRFRVLVRPAVLLMIFLMLAPSVYYSVPPMVYDNVSPIIVDDIRLGAEQWQSAVPFVASSIVQKELWGVRMAWLYVGGGASKEIDVMLDEQYVGEFPDLGIWVAQRSGTPILLRISLTTVPEYGYSPTPAEWRRAISETNVLYSTGEIVILLSPTR